MSQPFEFIVQGDIEAACVAILMAATEVTALCPSTNISTDMVGYQLGNPWVMVERQGGALKYPYAIDRPRVDFECRALRRSDAHDLAQVCQAALIRQSPVYSGKGVRITNAKIETGIYKHFDKNNEVAIYVFSLRFTAIPGPA